VEELERKAVGGGEKKTARPKTKMENLERWNEGESRKTVGGKRKKGHHHEGNKRGGCVGAETSGLMNARHVRTKNT